MHNIWRSEGDLLPSNSNFFSIFKGYFSSTKCGWYQQPPPPSMSWEEIMTDPVSSILSCSVLLIYDYTSLRHTQPSHGNITILMVALHDTTMQYTALHYTMLNWITLHFTMLYWIELHYTVLHRTTLHCTLQHCTEYRPRLPPDCSSCLISLSLPLSLLWMKNKSPSSPLCHQVITRRWPLRTSESSSGQVEN